MARSRSPARRSHAPAHVPAPKFVNPYVPPVPPSGPSILDGFKVGLGVEMATRAMQSVLGPKEVSVKVNPGQITEFQECMQKNQQNYSVCKDLLPK